MSMSRNLQDYAKVYDNFIDRSLCLKLTKQLESANWQQHAFYEPFSDQLLSYENELSVSADAVDGKDELMQRIWDSLKKYFSEDIANMQNWFSGWSGYSLVRFNKYDPTTQMKLHCDHIHSLFEGERKGIPVLTILGALNDDYTGGELIMWEDEIIKLKAGSIMVFPSNFLYPHEVRPVISGVRYSYVSWAW